MGGLISTSTAGVSEEDMGEVKKGIQDLIAQNKVVIFSKTTCPYCVDAKKVNTRSVLKLAFISWK